MHFDTFVISTVGSLTTMALIYVVVIVRSRPYGEFAFMSTSLIGLYPGSHCCFHVSSATSLRSIVRELSLDLRMSRVIVMQHPPSLLPYFTTGVKGHLSSVVRVFAVYAKESHRTCQCCSTSSAYKRSDNFLQWCTAKDCRCV